MEEHFPQQTEIVLLAALVPSAIRLAVPGKRGEVVPAVNNEGPVFLGHVHGVLRHWMEDNESFSRP